MSVRRLEDGKQVWIPSPPGRSRMILFHSRRNIGQNEDPVECSSSHPQTNYSRYGLRRWMRPCTACNRRCWNDPNGHQQPPRGVRRVSIVSISPCVPGQQDSPWPHTYLRVSCVGSEGALILFIAVFDCLGCIKANLLCGSRRVHFLFLWIA